MNGLKYVWNYAPVLKKEKVKEVTVVTCIFECPVKRWKWEMTMGIFIMIVIVNITVKNRYISLQLRGFCCCHWF